jgi:hypothetical protein
MTDSNNNRGGNRTMSGAIRVFGPTRLPCTNGTVRKFPTDMIAVTPDTAAGVFSLKILEKESAAAKVGLDLNHAPDMQATAPYKVDLIPLTVLGVTYDPPCVLVGGTKPGTDGPLNAMLEPLIKTEGNAADSSVTVELWAFLKTV